MCGLCRFENAADGAFKLEKQDAAVFEVSAGGFDVGLGEVPVCAGGHYDAVFRVLIHGNEGNSGRKFGAEDAACVQSFLFVLCDGVVSENVPSNLADELHVASKALCRHCLVRTLAAGSHGKDTAKDGFSGTGKGFGFDCHVSVAAAYDEDTFFTHIWCY